MGKCSIQFYQNQGRHLRLPILGGGHSALKVSVIRNPPEPRTLRLSSKNSLSVLLKLVVRNLPYLGMAGLQHNGEKNTGKTKFWKKPMWKFFALSNVPSKIKTSKMKIWGILMIIFVHWPNCESKVFIFLILNLNFRGVPSLFQGIVPGAAYLIFEDL